MRTIDKKWGLRDINNVQATGLQITAVQWVLTLVDVGDHVQRTVTEHGSQITAVQQGLTLVDISDHVQ